MVYRKIFYYYSVVVLPDNTRRHENFVPHSCSSLNTNKAEGFFPELQKKKTGHQNSGHIEYKYKIRKSK